MYFLNVCDSSLIIFVYSRTARLFNLNTFSTLVLAVKFSLVFKHFKLTKNFIHINLILQRTTKNSLSRAGS